MWEEIFNLALNNGLWAVLFLALLIYQLKDSRTREQKYQQTIFELNKTLNKVNKIDENVTALTENMCDVKDDINKLEDSVNMFIQDSLAKDKNKKKDNVNEKKDTGVLD
ncbi:MAG: BhlA/UviB family holin-like peptide [Firmicutes bacterium]|nr:BhlA/UviB family holin-like peptide [Bacillota bacterium]